jgi:glycolate oxidase FAD binding subunit
MRVRDFALAAKPAVILKSNFVISRQAEILGNYQKMAQAAGVGCAFICHAGNGILMTYILESGVAKTDPLVDLIGKFTAEAVKHDGNLVVESCPTELKVKINVWGQPRTDYVVMRRLKQEVDPAGVLNPGRFVGGI